MRVSDEYKKLLDSEGFSLSLLGVRDIALKRDDVLRAVAFLRVAEILIRGGDVYFRRGDRVESGYANWHSDPNLNQDRGAYLRRSWETTEAYVSKFSAPKDAEVLFSIVTG